MKRSVLAFSLSAAATFANVPSGAQTFQNGPYYANPSWDQQIPATQRFIVLSNWSNQAVLDRETGLVWERTPSGSEFTHWPFALISCAEAGTGNRRGWRTPSIQEMASLIDPASGNTLPPGNPFLGVAASPNFYWSATSSPDIFAWVVAFGAAGLHSVATAGKADAGLTWCVRSGSGPDVQ
jgi:hypothetical protein